MLLKLAASGLSREDAYEAVQRNAMKVWDKGEDFKTLLQNDPEVSARIMAKDIESCFDVEPYIKNVDYIFKRVFK